MESLKASVKGAGENVFTGAILGTPIFIRAEMLNNDDYNQKTDVYSMGCVFLKCAILNHLER